MGRLHYLPGAASREARFTVAVVRARVEKVQRVPGAAFGPLLTGEKWDGVEIARRLWQRARWAKGGDGDSLPEQDYCYFVQDHPPPPPAATSSSSTTPPSSTLDTLLSCYTPSLCRIPLVTMPSTPSNDANGPKTHQRNLSKANGKEM